MVDFEINNHAKEVSLYFVEIILTIYMEQCHFLLEWWKYSKYKKYKDGYLVRYPDKNRYDKTRWI